MYYRDASSQTTKSASTASVIILNIPLFSPFGFLIPLQGITGGSRGGGNEASELKLRITLDFRKVQFLVPGALLLEFSCPWLMINSVHRPRESPGEIVTVPTIRQVCPGQLRGGWLENSV
ncbi:hypothetical protein AVEN_178888-1 [Araneus ventricosus]|uniref:Uncharacterized protein n=1 Tax=Araneus ventricosus TaxID=182803 RepID=A0A4Y2Q3Z1_ARAVE|nr:hypothetical protein AVEN_178888-1 [Araneus ventricosus]